MPFEPWHLDWLTVQTEQAWVAATPEYGQALAMAGPAFSAFAGADVIACAGVVPLWEGRAQVWSLLSSDLARYSFGVHRAVKRFLDGYHVRRLECTVDPRAERAVRWARRLGFVYEGTMAAYTPQGHDMDMYVRIRR